MCANLPRGMHDVDDADDLVNFCSTIWKVAVTSQRSCWIDLNQYNLIRCDWTDGNPKMAPEVK